jgi:hypothetical protein
MLKNNPVCRLISAAAAFCVLAAPALAQTSDAPGQSRFNPIRVKLSQVPVAGAPNTPAPRGGCPATISSHTDANFEGGSFVAQAGFGETEIAAVSYVLPAHVFPIKIDLAEMIFATTNSSVNTTTQWSFLVWSGTPATGTLEYEFNSDGKILPHIGIPAGTNGVNVQLSVDPNDPDQMIIDDIGNQTFSIGFRIDQHHQQTQDPCFVAPPTCCNAFPTTDTGGLASPTNNWLFGIDCGPFGCPANGGWARFSQLPSFCRPSGDWVMRATWQSVNCSDPVGACCLANGMCDIRTQAACNDAGGGYRGDNVTCGAVNCLTGACCIGTLCLGGISESQCNDNNGAYQGNGTVCGQNTCTPACPCDFNGSGTLSSQDFFDFLSCFFVEGCTEADYNNSGQVNSQDFFEFLSCFFAAPGGC